MDREIWQTSVHGVTKSQTQGSDSAHTHIMEKGKKRHAKGKFGLGIRNEAGQRLIEFCKENALVIENILFQQHKRRLYTQTSPDGQHRKQIDYILCSQRWRSARVQPLQDPWEPEGKTASVDDLER